MYVISFYQAVSFSLAVIASVYVGIFENICDFMVTTGQKTSHDVSVGNCKTFMYKYSVDGISFEGSYTFQPILSVCVMLVLSFVVVTYQVLAIIHLFLDIKPLNIRIRCSKSMCSIFSIIVRKF